jgi:hypothetical protein
MRKAIASYTRASCLAVVVLPAANFAGSCADPTEPPLDLSIALKASQRANSSGTFQKSSGGWLDIGHWSKNLLFRALALAQGCFIRSRPQRSTD